jgi:hypothetical protein
MSEFHPQAWNITLLMILLVFLGFGGIGGGIALLMDPSGSLLGLPLDLLEGLFIESYLLPGFFLITAMGLGPYLVFFSFWKGLHWAWMAALIQGILLVAWIVLQLTLWGAPVLWHYLYLGWGIALIALSLLPATRKR